MPTTTIARDIWGCVDCLCYCVNGDLPTDSTPERDREIRDGVDSAAGYRRDYATAQLVSDSNSDTGDGINEFSASACDVCGSRLAGSRERFAVLADSKEAERVRSRHRRERAKPYSVHTGYDTNGRDKWRRFATLEDACAFRAAFHRRTGIVLAVIASNYAPVSPR